MNYFGVSKYFKILLVYTFLKPNTFLTYYRKLTWIKLRLYLLQWLAISHFLPNKTNLSLILKYIEALWELYYITITRPDIAISANKVSQFLHNPLDTHLKAVKRILRNLRGTITHGLTLRRSSRLSLISFSDADWGNDTDGLRSMTGFCIFLGENAVAWSSKKQHMVSISGTEAEYRSLANATTEIIWIQSLLQELQILIIRAPLLWCDNRSTPSLPFSI